MRLDKIRIYTYRVISSVLRAEVPTMTCGTLRLPSHIVILPARTHQWVGCPCRTEMRDRTWPTNSRSIACWLRLFVASQTVESWVAEACWGC